MKSKPFLLFRKQKKTALLAVLLVAALLTFCGVRLYGQSRESVETMAGENEERTPQSLFGLLEQKMDG